MVIDLVAGLKPRSWRQGRLPEVTESGRRTTAGRRREFKAPKRPARDGGQALRELRIYSGEIQ